MSLHGSFLSDEQFQCSICLDVFNNPSSTPCGHSFCMHCISRYWDGSKVCQCPLCKKTFQKRPDLQINRTLREITEQFRSMRGGAGLGREKRAGRGGGGGDGAIPDDVFEELRKKLPRPLPKVPSRPTFEPQEVESDPAYLSAGTPSLASSVPNPSPIAAMNNISTPPPPPPPYARSNSRRRFTVTGAASSQSLPVCETHHRGIMIYCRSDKVCICPECQILDHQDHDTVTVEEEWIDVKAQLSVSEREIQEMIRQRIRKMEEIRTSVAELELAVERETAGSVCLFSVLVSALERSQAELMEVMDMSRRAAEHQADAMIRQLELEVKELRRRSSALSELAQSDDHIHCVKTFPILASHPPARDWSAVSVNSDLGTGTIYRSLAAQVEQFQEELKNIVEKGFPATLPEPSPVRTQPRMKRVQEYAVDVTLDSNTAHPRLIMSEDMKSLLPNGKRSKGYPKSHPPMVEETLSKATYSFGYLFSGSVKCGDRHQLLPDNLERFDRVVCVLGREAITSGRHYWEVEVGGKTDWDLGVARQSINRKGKVEVTPSNGYWFLSLRDKNKYAFRSEPSTDVQVQLRPRKIGIFVDFEKGQVSFYNVDSKIHIYTFNDIFSECIYPFFSPCTNKSGKNEGPLIITPVEITE